MTANALITGGAGFIGYHLAKSLAEDGINVTVCDNLFRGKLDKELEELFELGNVNFVNCNLTEKEELEKLEGDFDYVYHLAAINGTRFFYEIPEKVLKVNVLSLINVLEWFVKNCNGKILFSSSSEVYAGTVRKFGGKIPTPEDIALTIEDVYNPRHSYAGSKIVGELFMINYSRSFKFPAVIVRYHNIYGPRMGYEHVIPEFCLRIIRKEHPFRIYGGTETRAFCFIEDAVRATRLAMESAETTGKILNIGNPYEEITIKQLAEKMFNLFGFKPEVEIKAAPEGSVNRRCPDISRISKLTGYKPLVSLDEGLKRTFNWYREAVRR